MLSDFDIDLIQIMVEYLSLPVWDGEAHESLLAEMEAMLFASREEMEDAAAPYDYCWWIAQWQRGLISDVDFWVVVNM